MKKSHFTAIALLTFTGLNLPASPSIAEEISCQGTLGAITVDNVKVPSGKTCTLFRTRVQGTVIVESNATLNARGARIIGNVQGENAAAVNVLANSTVGGSVQVKQGIAATVSASAINGDVQFDSNRGALVANNNRIGGSLQAFQNTGGLRIYTNRINGNLQCKENRPFPLGGGNIVQGSKEDQCSAL
ncbi:DUF3060 domain-containing protein [Tumidithrix helvetica PCC 7403]|uniref:hypothetical protein n=1 Tax=Tumidithrix helvetica TaxID=3457545 RepID=UPI003C81CFD1